MRFFYTGLLFFPAQNEAKVKNDIGTHGQVQGRLKVGVVPVGVNLRALPLRAYG